MKQLEGLKNEKFVLSDSEKQNVIGGGPGVWFSGHDEVTCIDGQERADFVRTDICARIQEKE